MFNGTMRLKRFMRQAREDSTLLLFVSSRVVERATKETGTAALSEVSRPHAGLQSMLTE
jgi:hypothetical protein